MVSGPKVNFYEIKLYEFQKKLRRFEMVSWFFPYNLVSGLFLWRILFIIDMNSLIWIENHVTKYIFFFNFIDQM